MSRKKHQNRRGIVSGLDQHKREGKRFVPPALRLPKLTTTSWRDHSLPELLWAILLAGNLERPHYFSLARTMGLEVQRLGSATNGGATHSDFAKLTADQFDAIVGPLLADAQARRLLSALLFFDHLPDRAHWAHHLEAPGDEEIDKLAGAVAKVLWHQSEVATDCRWVRIAFSVAAGKMHWPREFDDHMTKILSYPDGDDGSLGGSIRAGEMQFDMARQLLAEEGIGDADPRRWASDFWQECWDETACVLAHRNRSDEAQSDLHESLIELYRQVVEHFFETNPGTDIDARHDAVFGLVLYGLNLAISLASGEADRLAEGRLLVRSLTEVYITLAYLVRRDEEGLWLKYRQYGTGQAKLAFLKLIDLGDEHLPTYVDPDELERLANEDMWHEFVAVDVGQWAGSDLRKMSEEAGAKGIYDKYYGWPSGFVHGQWAAVRDTVFDQCLNPLHRNHRVPSAPRLDMGSCRTDGVQLANLLLDLLGQAYPPFKARVRLPSDKPGAATGRGSGGGAA